MQVRLRFGFRYCALLLLHVATPVSADNWNYGTTLGLSSDWNDNPSLADDFIKTESTFRFLASYDAEFERQDDTTTFNLRPRVTTDYYPDSQFSDLQATDLFLPGNYVYRRPLSSWTLNFNASRQSVLSDEATTSQQAPIGTLRGDDTLTLASATPALLWQLSEKDELQIGLTYSIADYDLEFTNRSDSYSLGANFSYKRRLNERHSVGISGLTNSSNADRRARFTFPDNQTVEGEITNDSTSSYFTADYDYALSETSSLNISYGIQDATIESKTNPPIDALNFGKLDFSSSTFDVGYLLESERTSYRLEASRIVTLDITNGQPQDRYQLIFDGEHRISEKLLGGWRLLAWTQEAVALETLDENDLPVNFSRKLTYSSAEARLSWNLTRKWYLTGRYEYRWRDTDQSTTNINQNLTATSNQLTIGISYAWKELPRR